jgi:2,3-bisphosphoglycerate-dependent phosphoglycerate mutase
MLAVAANPGLMTQAMRSLEAAFLIGVEGVTEIWLIRHVDCYQGMVATEDPPLSPLGRDQARRLAERVRRTNPMAVYTSPYRRAVETARAISPEGVVPQIDERLKEMKLELVEGGTFDFKEDPNAVIERMRSAIDDIARANPGQRVAVVGHAAAILGYLTDVLKLEPGHLRLLPYFTSVSVVRALGDRRMVGALGDTAHLE